MRGKSIDKDFVTSFIQECAGQGKGSPEEICEEAIHRMNEIDKQLKLRIKLADVLSFFNHKKKATVSVPEQKLPSYEDVDKRFARAICELARSGMFSFQSIVCSNDLQHFFRSNEETIYTLKKLVEMKVINSDAEEGWLVKPAENFDHFMKYAWQI